MTHIDYSARVQTVDRETNPRYHALISRFKEMTGCHVLVNTSFNVRGEPIVCNADDAFQYLVGLSNDRNQKLRDLAASLVSDDPRGLEPMLQREARIVRHDVAGDHVCQMGGSDRTACCEIAEVKLTDSWGDSAWSCLSHAEEALLAARGIFMATQDAEGLAAYRRRGATVEPVIGHLKDRIGLRRFSRRGLRAAAAELHLAAAMVNLTRLHNTRLATSC